MKTFGIMLCLLLVAAGGCISDITGAQHRVAFCDPATGKEIGVWSHNGDTAKMRGVTLHIDKETYFRIGSMDTTDEIGGYQTQAFIKQQDTANSMMGTLMNGLLSALGKSPVPIIGTEGGFVPKTSTGGGGVDIMALMENAETDAERLLILKILTPKPKAKRTQATQPARSSP